MGHPKTLYCQTHRGLLRAKSGGAAAHYSDNSLAPDPFRSQPAYPTNRLDPPSLLGNFRCRTLFCGVKEAAT